MIRAQASVLFCSLSLFACQAEPPATPGGTPAATETPAPVTTHESATPAMPPGHPPVGGGSATQPAAPAGHGGAPASSAPALAWTAPETWKSEQPASSMRKAQYRVPGPGGDAECVVFYFGPGQGGDPVSNAQRWADQFTPPPGTPAGQHAKTTVREVNGKKVTLVEAKGTYTGGMAMQPGGATPEAKPGSMMLAAIVPGPDANWFFKLTGPEATVEASRAAFDALVGSVK